MFGSEEQETTESYSNQRIFAAKNPAHQTQGQLGVVGKQKLGLKFLSPPQCSLISVSFPCQLLLSVAPAVTLSLSSSIPQPRLTSSAYVPKPTEGVCPAQPACGFWARCLVWHNLLGP